jgi:glycosyltransferase involved in cell wall biosynthesis
MAMVSVIIPVFNSAPFLDAAIASVAAQSHRDLEVIMVDDGSADSSVDIARRALDEYALSGAVFRRPRESRKGAGTCRNLGVSRASGEFLAFQDSDDLWLPQHLDRALSCFGKYGGEMGVYCARGELIESGGRRSERPVGDFPASGLVDALPIFLQGMRVPNISVCVRRALFDATKGYSEELKCYEDWWLMLQLSKVGKFYFNPEADVLIRHRANSLSRENRADRKSPVMSRAMYRDQLKLYCGAKGSGIFSKVELKQLGETIVGWNSRQLGDLACGGRFKEVHRLLHALMEAGVEAAPLIFRIVARMIGNVGKRAGVKTLRMARRRTRSPAIR